MMSSAKGTVAHTMTSKSSISGGSGSSGSTSQVHPKLLDGSKFVKWDDVSSERSSTGHMLATCLHSTQGPTR